MSALAVPLGRYQSASYEAPLIVIGELTHVDELDE
jgi:hypothetical protein